MSDINQMFGKSSGDTPDIFFFQDQRNFKYSFQDTNAENIIKTQWRKWTNLTS